MADTTRTFQTLAPAAPLRLRSARAAALAALVIGITLLPAAAGAPASAKVVGEVVAVGGSKKLTTVDPATGKLHRVKPKDRLTLGQVLVMGAKVTATLRVRIPKGVNPDRDLVELTPVRGTPHRVLVSRKGAYTIVTILPDSG